MKYLFVATEAISNAILTSLFNAHVLYSNISNSSLNRVILILAGANGQEVRMKDEFNFSNRIDT